MAHALHHAQSTVNKWGGKPEDYLKIHQWFDQTKITWADPRHRAILHNTFGIFLCEQVFGPYIINSDNKRVPVRIIAEQHVKEDCGGIPTVEDWLKHIPMERWMRKGYPMPVDMDGNKNEN